jgi:hypothetical protein
MNKVLALVLSVAFASSMLAHAGHKHLFGVVKSVDGDRVVVHSTAGADTTVLLTKDTSYKRGDAGAKQGDVVEGVRVVIDLSSDGTRAEIVKIGAK